MTHSRHPALASLHRLMIFAQSIKIRRMVVEIAHEPKQTFWIMTANLLADTAAIEWCKVFGSRNENTHWTQVIPGNQHSEVRSRLLSAIDLTQAEWENYRENILRYRDQMVAHHDIDATVANYPHYDVAINAANFIFDQIRNNAAPNSLSGIPASLDGWSRTVVNNMRVIVKKAFEASATLGSNVPTDTGV